MKKSGGNKGVVLQKGGLGECTLVPALGVQEYQTSQLSSARGSTAGKKVLGRKFQYLGQFDDIFCQKSSSNDLPTSRLSSPESLMRSVLYFTELGIAAARARTSALAQALMYI